MSNRRLNQLAYWLTFLQAGEVDLRQTYRHSLVRPVETNQKCAGMRLFVRIAPKDSGLNREAQCAVQTRSEYQVPFSCKPLP